MMTTWSHLLLIQDLKCAKLSTCLAGNLGPYRAAILGHKLLCYLVCVFVCPGTCVCVCVW